MEPLTLILLGAGGYYVYKKNENPEWSPLTWICSSPYDKHVALERVKVASVPTPGASVALDPGMSTDQVKQVNHALTTETDHQKIKAHADALGALGHTSSAAALDAKAQAVGEAKAHGANEAEIHSKQIEAQAPAPPPAVGWGPYAAGADAVFGTQSYGYPWSDVSYDYSMHPEHLTGIQSGPAIVGIQSGPAIVGIQSGPAIVGWDGRERFGRHGRYLPHRGRERFEQRRPEWEHHRRRHHFRPEEVVEEPMPMPEPEFEPEIIEVPEEMHVEHEHRHREHHEMPLPPPPPPQHVQPGIVTNGYWAGWEDMEDMVGVAQYGGGGLVAEYPGVPQQAQPYGAPVGQYQQQQQQPYAPQLPYGADLTQQYAQYPQQQQYQYPQYEAVPEAEVVYQPEYPQYQPHREERYRRPWGGYGRGYRHPWRRW